MRKAQLVVLAGAVLAAGGADRVVDRTRTFVHAASAVVLDQAIRRAIVDFVPALAFAQ